MIYILPLHRLILSHGLSVHGYADDTQVYLSISDPTNSDSVSKLKSLDLDSLTVAGSSVIITDKPVRNLGVMMDQKMAMSAQVHQVVRMAYHHY